MTDFKTVSLADQVFEKLENDIITGVYPKGEILTELKLVEQLGVSRTPIREALRRLEQERLIRDSGKGSVVLGITVEDLVDIMDIRQRIEGLAAYYATSNLTPEGLEELRQISELQDFYYEKKDIDNLRQMDDRFHDTIYELSGRTVIRDTLLPLHRKTMRYRRLSIGDAERLEHSVAEHKAIYQAITTGQAELAAERITAHIVNAKESMIARFDYHG
ncbi:MAG: GntR family transcriptional regulator [Oscillospiraceae bacterium]|nr:GntR family transcriptional regulator [Oscillospiraceae bacterium]